MLFNCPFCGHRAELHYTDQGSIIRCVKCRAMMTGNDRNRLIKAWNRRYFEPMGGNKMFQSPIRIKES